MTRKDLEPDCYVKLADGEGGVRWVACMRLGTRAIRDDDTGLEHVEVLVRPLGALTMAWVHANLSAAEPPADGEVDVA